MWSSSTNKFTGLIDKILLVKNTLTDYDFTQYSKNYGFYGNNQNENTWDNLIFRYNFDYPIDLRTTTSIYPYFPEGKSEYTGHAYNFTYTNVTQSNSCTYILTLEYFKNTH